MVVSLNGNRGFTVSFDPNLQLLVEKGQINYMQDGQGTPMADYDLYEDKDLPAVIDRNGKQYSVRFMTWDRDTEAPKIGLFFEIDIDDIPSASAGPAVDAHS
jgi:hypothetical protein